MYIYIHIGYPFGKAPAMPEPKVGAEDDRAAGSFLQAV